MSALFRVVATVALGALVLVGCARQEVTYTVNGEEVLQNPPTGPAADIDPCMAVTGETLERLGLAEVEPVEMVGPIDDGCTWDGGSHYLHPSMVLWVDGPTGASPTDEIVDIAGVAVNVYAIGSTSGRLIAYFDDLTLAVNYKKAKVEVDTFEALEAAMTDVLESYSRTGTA